jgi:hypothetical protein
LADSGEDVDHGDGDVVRRTVLELEMAVVLLGLLQSVQMQMAARGR